MAVAFGAPHVVAFTHFAFVVDDAAFQHEGLLDLDVLVQRQLAPRLPAEEGGEQAAFLILVQDLHLHAGVPGGLPGQFVNADIARSKGA